ncbi:aryl-alcohol dehydrogenase [Sinorhizobium meliloti CCNWSX0020]|uniref:Aryl-alcohol dehydrogenase n=2 Tax=Sinorhizobium TaxID=28105 RepID=H0GAV8_RHIML|nr:MULTISPECIES: aldo/keto reductase [Sinorhizobium]EHK73571.1 aryl-alcohol dehydrogenase [Sinorhizobium meliloti CCNWSX0020]WHS94657.1 aldo/keto reductase [Sinorhizobium kummerowiae]WRW46602.1 aldo/keto reductase [Sinorhizobium kummerowiae]
MEYRRLGRSGLKISTITMGTMTIGGGGKFAQVGDVGIADARRYVDLCLDAGVNLIDTADIYSTGACEEIIGEVLGGKRKDGVLIATKARFSMGPGPNDGGLSRHHLISACEASLKRLKTDVIDLYQVHEWDGQTPLEETMEALDTLVRQGKVRYIGCSNYSGWHIMKALGISALEHRQRFVSQQIHYTLEAREAEYELVPISIDQGLGILVWSPLAGGLLSGKHRRGQSPEGTRQLAGWNEPPIRDEERLWKIVDLLVAIAAERNVSPAQIALAWLIGRDAVTSVIIGGRTEDQFRDNLAAAGLKLTDEERELLDAVSLPPVLYPYWHQLWTAKDRLGEADLSLLEPHI